MYGWYVSGLLAVHLGVLFSPAALLCWSLRQLILHDGAHAVSCLRRSVLKTPARVR
jgi:hypothetical protein